MLPQIHDDSERVPLARRLLAKGDALSVIEVLKSYASRGGGADADQAVHLLGLAHLRTREWASAEIEFERVVREYPESDSATAAMVRLGDAYLGQSRGPDFDQTFTLKAQGQYEAFLRDAPASDPLRPVAEQRLGICRTRLATKLQRTGELYLKMHEWGPAQRYFQDVIDHYADTAPYGEALLGISVADVRLGQSEIAEARLRELAKQFADEPLGKRAEDTLHDIERGRLRPDTGHHRRRSIEGEEPPPAVNPSPGG